jgi:hypothetical protein
MATKKKELALVSKDILFEDQGSGAEGIDTQDLMIPRISILQQGSPQISKRDSEYVEGAESGSIFNTVTRIAKDGEQGITVLPIKYRRAYIEWKPNRGGFVRDHGNNGSILDQCEQDQATFKHINSEGNEIVTTAEYFLFMLDDAGGYETALLSMSGSQLKKSRRWNSMMSQLKLPKPDKTGYFNPAMFYTCYKLTTCPEENDLGSWFGWDIEMLHGDSGGIIENVKGGEEVYMAARSFKEKVVAGSVQVSPEDEEAF